MANEVRLIDANALKQMFDEREADDVEWFGGVRIAECFPADDAKEMVDKMPTVDAVPVVHGRWKGAGTGDYYCSVCQQLVNPRTNYCPNCGAKMDGDGNG